jgi:hypothetical protein
MRVRLKAEGIHVAIARMATRIAMEEFHRVVPDYDQVAADQALRWMPCSTFRSPLVYELAAA